MRTNDRIKNQTLIERAQDGDKNARSDIVVLYEGTCQRWLRAQFGGRLQESDLEDLSQDMAIAIADSVSRFKFKSRFTTYCCGIAKRLAFDRLRQFARERTREASAHSSGFDEHECDTNFEKFERQEKIMWVMNKVDQLDDRAREVIKMKFIDGKSHQEISLELNISNELSRQVLRRALCALREKWKTELGPSEF